MELSRGPKKRRILMAAVAVGLVLAAHAAGARADAGPVLPMLTEKPLVVWRFHNVSGALDAFTETRVGRQVRQSPLLDSILELRRSALCFGAAVLADFSEETVERLLKGEIALVVLPSSGSPDGEPSVALVWSLGDDAAMVRNALEERVIPRLQAGNVRLSVGVEGAGKAALLHVWQGAKSLYVRVVDGALVLGTAKAVDKFSPSRTVPEWASAEASDGTVSSVLLNLEPVWAAARATGRPDQAERLRASGIAAVRDVRAATAVAAGGFKDTIVARLESEVGGLLNSLISLEPGTSGCASVIPPEYALMAAWQIESGERFYELIEDLVRRTRGEAGLQEFRQTMGSVGLVFGIDVGGELMPAIGNEVFVAVRLPDMATLPAGAAPRKQDVARIFGFAVRDAAALREIIRRFAASAQAQQAGWELTTEQYRDAEVYTLANAIEQSRLCLAILGRFLVCSESADWLKDSVRAVADGRVLAADTQYGAVLAQLPSQTNALFYVDTRPLRELVMAIVRMKGRGEAEAFQPLIEQAVPHLGGYGLAAVYSGDQVRVEGYGDVPAAFLAFNAALLGAMK